MTSRRRVIRAATLASASFLAGMLAIGAPLALFKTTATTPAVPVSAAASDTDILVAPSRSRDVQLIDHAGSVVHEWHLADGTTGTVEMLADGSLLYIATRDQGAADPNPLGGDGKGLRRVRWDGDPLWSYDDPNASHDFAVLPDGTVAVLHGAPIDAALAAQVQGGVPGSEFNGQMWADQIVEVDPDTNQTRVVFDATDALDPVADALPEWMPRSEWTHANSLAYIPSDPITGQEAYLISYRAISTIEIVSRATGKVIWSYGGKWVLNQQHDASFLPNGDVMVFDNGQYLRAEPSSSQVQEIDPRTNTVVWSFPEIRPVFTTLYSAIIGGAQRLDNGNTLITYGVQGRLLEVTPDHSVAWDSTPSSGDAIFKARAYPTTLVDQLLASH